MMGAERIDAAPLLDSELIGQRNDADDRGQH
jgi:hypothetical protein